MAGVQAGRVTRIQLADCTFAAEPNTKGLFVGRCREFPDIRTRPYRSRLDAIDAAIDTVRDHIAQRDSFTNIKKGG